MWLCLALMACNEADDAGVDADAGAVAGGGAPSGGSAGPGGAPTGAGGSPGGAPGGAGGSAGAGGDAPGGAPPPPPEGGSEPPPDDTCFIDAYCPFPMACDGDAIVSCFPVSCSSGPDACSEPCSGTNYDTSGMLCDPGQVCVWTGAPSYARHWFDNGEPTGSVECLPVESVCRAGEPEACPPDQFCRVVDGYQGWGFEDACAAIARGAYGRCMPRPAASDCPAESTPVTGCDGAEYPGPCAAAAAGVSVPGLATWSPP